MASTVITTRPLGAEAAILASAAIYGSTFAIVQDGLDDLSAVGFLTVRFVIGAVALAPFAVVRARRHGVGAGTEAGERNGLDRATERDSGALNGFAVAALVFGVVGFAGFAFQNAGLERTSTSNSAFITGLYVVFTPMLQTFVDRRRPPANVLVAVAGALVGLFLMTGADLSMSQGDALTLVAAALFGWWIFLAGRYSRFDPIVLTCAQMTVFVVVSIPFVAVGGFGELTAAALVACIYTGLVASAGAFTLQLWGQREVTPARSGVLLLLEPVVAGIVGYWIGERLGVGGYLGAAVILASIVVAESGAWRSSGIGDRSAARLAPESPVNRLTESVAAPTIGHDREGTR